METCRVLKFEMIPFYTKQAYQILCHRFAMFQITYDILGLFVFFLNFPWN